MRQPFVLFKGLTFQKLCLPGAFRPGDHHNKMLRPGYQRTAHRMMSR
nr:Mobile element protein [uncultured bacterium]